MSDIMRTALTVAAAVIVALSGYLSDTAMASTRTPATAETSSGGRPVVVASPSGEPTSNPVNFPTNGYACRGINSGTGGVNRTWCSMNLVLGTFEVDGFGDRYAVESWTVRFTITPSPSYPTIDYTALYSIDSKDLEGFSSLPLIYIYVLCSSGDERCGWDLISLRRKSSNGQVRIRIPSMRGHSLAIAIAMTAETAPLFGSKWPIAEGRTAWAACKSNSLCAY